MTAESLQSEPEGESPEQELGEFLWIFCKKISAALEERILHDFERDFVYLEAPQKTVLRRECMVIGLWVISRSLIEKPEALEFMHQRYLRGYTQFFDPNASGKEAWETVKKELSERYGQYYSHGDGNKMTPADILSLSEEMLDNMVRGKRLDYDTLYQKVLITHLKDVMVNLVQLKKEYDILSGEEKK